MMALLPVAGCPGNKITVRLAHPTKPERHNPTTMTTQPKTLLAVIEFIHHGRLPDLYKQLGFDVTPEWRVRKAVSLVRKLKPDVIVADFYFQSDFRDRLSNLESLLATAQPFKETRILVLYDPQDTHALDKVRERMRIDAVLPTPVSDEAIKAVLNGWR
jgi:DNA-binding NarL/FixJ family response regulator